MEADLLPDTKDIRWLREYLAPDRLAHRQDWLGWVVLALAPILLLIWSQAMIRWLPGHPDADGLAICQVHHTLRHGPFWWPTDPGLHFYFRRVGTILTLLALYAGVGMWAAFHHERRARRFAHLIARAYPQLTFPPYGSRRVA